MRRGTSRTIAVAVTAALAATGTAAMADGSKSASKSSDKNYKFATVKAGHTPGKITQQTLVVFDDDSRSYSEIKGLASGERVVGLDVRPANNALYGVSSANRVFTIDTSSGQIANVQTLSVPLSGSFFGVDFNPSVDRLRITSDAEQNLRVNVDTGATTADPALQYPVGDRNAGQDPAVAAVGYTFAPLAGPTALYDVDSARDTFTLQNPPNAGTLNSIGPIGVDVPAQGGFDIAGKEHFKALGFYQQGSVARLYEHRFDQNGRARATGLALTGQYDGFAVLNAYGSGH